jgi:hypothetical protein
MLFLSGVLTKDRGPFLRGELGLMATPLTGYDLDRLPGVIWAADNGCFSDRWDADRWWAWLQRWTHRAGDCLFAVAPDVVGDHQATVAKSAPWLQPIRDLGYPVAWVAQDGWDEATTPWDSFDWLFIGGSTEFKCGVVAARAAKAALARGKRVHMGRVNSGRRVAWASLLGCDTVDGTKLAFGPDVNLPVLRRMMTRADQGHLALDWENR